MANDISYTKINLHHQLDARIDLKNSSSSSHLNQDSA